MKSIKMRRLHAQNQKNLMATILFVLLVAFCGRSFAVISTTDSTSSDVLPTAKSPNKVLLLTSGFLDSVPASFNIPMRCPTGFNEFITIAVNRIEGSVDTRLLRGSKVCISSRSLNSGSVTVNLSRTVRYETYGSNTYSGKWISKDEGAFVVNFTDQIGTLSTITEYGSGTNVTSMARALSWQLYCFPSGMTVPSYAPC